MAKVISVMDTEEYKRIEIKIGEMAKQVQHVIKACRNEADNFLKHMDLPKILEDIKHWKPTEFQPDEEVDRARSQAHFEAYKEIADIWPEVRLFGVKIEANRDVAAAVSDAQPLALKFIRLLGSTRVVVSKMFEKYAPNSENAPAFNEMRRTTYQRLDELEALVLRQLMSWGAYFTVRPNIVAMAEEGRKNQDLARSLECHDEGTLMNLALFTRTISTGSFLLEELKKEVEDATSIGNSDISTHYA